MFKVRMSDGTEFGPGDLDTIVQWCREGRIPREALLYPTEGGEPKSVFAEPRLAALLNAPPTAPSTIRETKTPHTSTSRLIPTGNMPALWGYYLAVFSLIPFLLFLAPVAIVLGCIGLIRVHRHPQARGTIHALIAVLLGITTLIGYALLLNMFVNDTFSLI